VCLGAYAHQDVPFERLVEEVAPRRSLTHTPLFQVMFALQNTPQTELPLQTITWTPFALRNEAAKFELQLSIAENEGEWQCTLQYQTDLFEASRIERMQRHWIRLLEEVALEPARRLSQLEILTDEERVQLLEEWNHTGRLYEGEDLLHHLFERQAAQTPDSLALVFDDERLTYRELNERANRLAHYLRRHENVDVDTLVGVLMERSTEMVVSLLGILKAGAAYVPFDPSYPQERLAFMAQDAQVTLLLTQQRWRDAFSLSTGDSDELSNPRMLCLDTEWDKLSDESCENPQGVALGADNLAYMIYTSGSTGQPKGAMNTHGAIRNRLLWMQEQYQLTPDDRVLQKTPFSFDVSVWEFFWPLLTGAQLIVAKPGGHQDAAYLVELIKETGITTLHFVPSMLGVFLAEGGVSECRSVRQVMASGEALAAELVRRCYERMPQVRLHNLYGPTEAAVDVTAWACAREVSEVIPIGKPIANTQIYILDAGLQPVPVGVAGELYIAGVGLARGYLNRPELTAERFIPNPFRKDGGGRLYRTGDRARFLADGTIEYLGRVDYQVKVRGFRIELGEIEAALSAHARVNEAIVIAREDETGDKKLVAYLVAGVESVGGGVETATAPALTVKELRAHLAARLPDYMIPAHYVWLESLPLTPNGKVDRKALPAPDKTTGDVGGFVAPGTPVEEIVAGLFAAVLKLERVGVHDNFFELGGHSLLATQLVSRVREAFGVEVPLRTLFEAPTASALAAAVEAERAKSDAGRVEMPPPLVRGERGGAGEAALSYAQQRLWFLDQLEPGNVMFNLFQAARLGGELDVAAFERAVNEVVRRHESLRTTFEARAGAGVQVIHPPQPLTLEVIRLNHLPEAERETEARRLALEEARRPFDLQRGPLARVSLLKLTEDEHVLLCTMHHIVSDGWSLSVLVKEVATLYTAYVAGEETPLPELPVQYADYARWQREWLTGAVLDRQVAYWREQLRGAPETLELPTDRPRPEVQTFAGEKYPLAFSKALTEDLKALGRRENVTLFMTLVAAFQTLLHHHTGREDIVIGTDEANRTHGRTENLIGFFINQLVLRTNLSGVGSFRELLGRVRETALGAYAHRELPFEKLVEVVNPARSAKHAPVFQVKLVLQNMPAEELDMPGLRLEPFLVDTVAAKFELTPMLWEKPEGLAGWFEYNRDLFTSATVERFARQFELILSAVAAEPAVTLAELKERLATDDRAQLARERTGRAESLRQKFKSVKPKAVSLSDETLIKRSYLPGGEGALPLVVEPLEEQMSLPGWARSNRSLIERELHAHGAILFRGFNIATPDAFEQFAGAAVGGQLFNENGEHPRKSLSGNIYTPVAYPADKLLLWHNENSFNDRWPMKIMFCCAQPALVGGETPLVDSHQVFQLLDPKIRERFIERDVMYVRNYEVGLGLNWQTVLGTNDRARAEQYCRDNRMSFEWKEGDRLRTRAVRPAAARHPQTGKMVWFNQAQHWHVSCLDPAAREAISALFSEEDMPRNCYYGDGTPIEDSIMQEILGVYRQLEVCFPWRRGDVVLLDNMLAAHGRNPYRGERKLFVAMGEMMRCPETDAVPTPVS
jgi:amino acid adenylation domain-containing protein